jgi:hypothetical protein
MAVNDLFKNNVSVPSVEMIQKCINHTMNVNDEEEMILFQWYWEVSLPKMVDASEWETLSGITPQSLLPRSQEMQRNASLFITGMRP